MQDLNLFALYIDIIDRCNVPYFVTGSVASIVYGDPRMTHDIDLVINLTDSNVDLFLKAFPSDQFYCPPEEIIRTEINRSSRGHFNLIHHETGFKVYIYLTNNSEFQLWALKNCKLISFAGTTINIAPAEYVIIMKLEFFREGKSSKHLTDIKSMLLNSGDQIDFGLLNKLINEKDLTTEWEAAQ